MSTDEIFDPVTELDQIDAQLTVLRQQRGRVLTILRARQLLAAQPVLASVDVDMLSDPAGWTFSCRQATSTDGEDVELRPEAKATLHLLAELLSGGSNLRCRIDVQALAAATPHTIEAALEGGRYARGRVPASVAGSEGSDPHVGDPLGG